jgi:hypothetical protein
MPDDHSHVHAAPPGGFSRTQARASSAGGRPPFECIALLLQGGGASAVIRPARTKRSQKRHEGHDDLPLDAGGRVAVGLDGIGHGNRSRRKIIRSKDQHWTNCFPGPSFRPRWTCGCSRPRPPGKESSMTVSLSPRGPISPATLGDGWRAGSGAAARFS